MLQIFKLLIGAFAATGITWHWRGFKKVAKGWLAAESSQVDTKDCYFDLECHDLVNWDKIGEIKKGFFARLKFMKEKHNRDAVKPMMLRVHRMFVQAGVPDDRVNYILEKWVKYVYPEALDEPAEHKKGCYDKGSYGVWCPKGDGWQCVKNCKKKDLQIRSKATNFEADEKGCYDKGKHGVWCPKGDGWQCIKNCDKKDFRLQSEATKMEADEKGCYDKGKHGVWCPKGDGWQCIKNCEKKDFELRSEATKIEADEKGCYDKGKHGVWCPKDDGWQCIKNCEKRDLPLRPGAKQRDENGCYDKGVHGVWCPKSDGWQCVKNCKEERMSYKSAAELGQTVDWGSIEKIKSRFLARVKMIKKKDTMRFNGKRMMQHVHPMLVEAGLPVDRVDTMLKKWFEPTTTEPTHSAIVV